VERPELIKKYLTDEEQFRWRIDPEKMLQEAKKRQGEDKGWKKAIQRTREREKKRKDKLKKQYNGPNKEFIKIPNKLIEAVYKQYLRPNESKVFWFVLRKTWGWNKKSDFIGLNQFVKELGLLKPHICRTLSELEKRGIVTKLGNKTYAIQMDYSLWHDKPREKRKT